MYSGNPFAAAVEAISRSARRDRAVRPEARALSYLLIALTGHMCHVSAMTFEELLARVPAEGVFRTGQILAGERSPEHVRRQLHRWCTRGRILKLRRGVYMVNERRSGDRAHPFVIANYLKKGSYVSLQSALSHYGMIPEYVPVTTSVTTGRPETVSNDVGEFQFRHIHRRLFRDFESVHLTREQHAFMATPEKALLDLLYLTPESDNIDLLKELRLTPPETLTPEAFLRGLQDAADDTGVAKLRSAAERLQGLLP